MEEPSESRTRIRTVVVFSMLFAVLGAVVVFAYFSTFSRPVTTVVLVRHAEKKTEPDNPNPDLSPAGQARAQELVRVLGNAGVSAIYTSQFVRTQQTAQPLANHLRLSLTKVDAGNTEELVRQIITNQSGGIVFVAGHNNTVPAAIAALGGGDFPIIPENEFDNLFIVTVYRFGRAKVVKLKYGNTSPTGGGTGTMVP
jgi:2,3-bisphosphoglycerate-dependent phosphoglycerate mutase